MYIATKMKQELYVTTSQR